MALFFKKKREEELPPLESLPPLPPLPGEEEGFPPQVPMRMAMQQSLPELPPLPPLPPLQPQRMQMERQQAPEKATVFVRVDKYKEIMQTVESMEQKVQELQGTLDKIASIKEKEGEIIRGWGAMLQEAKSKIDDVNSKLLRPTEA